MKRIGLILPLLLVWGCRGTPSENAPFHAIFNMDDQPKYEPFERSDFFADGAAMRMPVEGTVARGDLREDAAYYEGFTPEREFVRKNPLPLTAEVMRRGQDRYQIFCRPCHGAVGDGQGMIAKRGIPLGYVPPTSFHSENIRSKPEGYLYWVISNGVRNMGGYKHQIPVEDRWSIVHYMRALQRSQYATLADVPEALRYGLMQEASP